VRTLGVDLASQKEGTALAVIRWAEGGATLEQLACGVEDEGILRCAKAADAIGIDAPFGWPRAFLDMVERREPLGPWTKPRRDQLRFRRTDLYVQQQTKRWPLSVSSDLIAIPAMRCQGLLDALKVTDRSGDGRVFEVYPRAGLQRWGLEGWGYKGKAKATERSALWSTLRALAPWLDVPSAAHAALVATSHDAFDAVVAAMLARAAMIGACDPVPEQDRDHARTEGWIVLPREGSLAELPRPFTTAAVAAPRRRR
jgi:predicted nuclease with RNAse H fold